MHSFSVLNATEVFHRADMSNTLLTIEDKDYEYDDIIKIEISNLNNIQSIRDLPMNLRELMILKTTLSSLEIPTNCVHLQVLSIKDSNLTRIPNVSHCTKLNSLSIEHGALNQMDNIFPASLVNINLTQNSLNERNCDLRLFPRGVPIILFRNVFNEKPAMDGYIFCYGTQNNGSRGRRITNYDVDLNRHQVEIRDIIDAQRVREPHRMNRDRLNQLVLQPAAAAPPARPPTTSSAALFNSSQTVHISSICKSVTDSVNKIKQLTDHAYTKSLEPVLIDQMLTQMYDKNFLARVMSLISKQPKDRTNMTTYVRQWVADRSIHTASNTKYSEMLARVWILVDNHTQKKDFMENLKIELESSKDVCFTGRYNRLINSLVGFIDGITVGISLKEQLQIEIGKLIENLGRERMTYAECKKQMEALFNEPEVKEDETITKEYMQSWLDALEDYKPDDVEAEEANVEAEIDLS